MEIISPRHRPLTFPIIIIAWLLTLPTLGFLLLVGSFAGVGLGGDNPLGSLVLIVLYQPGIAIQWALIAYLTQVNPLRLALLMQIPLLLGLLDLYLGTYYSLPLIDLGYRIQSFF